MKEVWVPGMREAEKDKKTSTGFLQKYAPRAAVLFAIAFPCNILDHQEPAPTMTPSSAPSVYQLPPSATFKSTEAPTPIPLPTPTKTPVPTPEIRPTPTPTTTPSPPETPRPTPTKTPEPTPTLTPTPTPTPEPTRTPMPTPKPTPYPTPTLAPTPTPVPKIELEPGEKRDWVQQIENKSYEPKKRSIDLEFQGGNKENLKIEIRIPPNSDKIISEGSVFIVPPRGVSARITAIVPPGASPTCIDSISSKLQSEEEGRGNEPLARVLLDQNICIKETLLVFFSQHTYHEEEQLVISRLHFYNLAGIKQKTRFWVDIDKCSFPIAERTFISGSKKISPDEPVAIPAESIVTYFMRSTPPADKKPSSPYCLVRSERILEK